MQKRKTLKRLTAALLSAVLLLSLPALAADNEDSSTWGVNMQRTRRSRSLLSRPGTLLDELRRSLLKRSSGEVTKGRKPTEGSVEKHVSDILHPEFMEDIFDVAVTADQDGVHLDFALNGSKLERIQEHFLGKTIPFTDNHHWSDEQIVAAYRSQYHIEGAFKQMKNTKFLGLRPIYHWTDQKIRVHAFYCVLVLRLCCLLQRILHDHDIDLSLNRMLSLLSEIQQIVTVYPKQGASKKDRESFSLTMMEPEQKKMLEVLNINQYALRG